MHLRATDDPGWQFDRLNTRRLNASLHVPAIATLLARASALLQGWTPRDVPTHRHQQAAELAIRWSCEEYRVVAKHAAEDYGVQTFAMLEERLRSCDTTPDRRYELIKQFVREVLDVREWHLLHDVGRAPCEQREFDRLLDSEDGEEP